MKAGWSIEPLGNVAQVVNGGTPKSAVSEYWGGEIQWLTPKDMGKLTSPFVSVTPRTISDLGLSKSSARVIPANSVILSTRAPIGHLAINEVPMSFNQGCRGIVPNERLDVRYAYYFLTASRGELNKRGTGTTFKELSATNLKSLPVALPPLGEQKQIVAVLDKAFEGLDRARENTEANLASAKELYDSWLASVFENTPASWTKKNLEKFCSKITVGHVGPMKTKYKASGIPFLRSQNVRPFKIDLEGVKFIDHEFHEELSKSELKPGDVAIVRTGYPGTAAVVPSDLNVANCADIVIARTTVELSPHFLAMFMNSDYGKRLVSGAAVGAAQKHFNVGAAKKVMFSAPPIERQTELVEQSDRIHSQVQATIEALTSKLEGIRELRQSLLQHAFAGELTQRR